MLNCHEWNDFEVIDSIGEGSFAAVIKTKWLKLNSKIVAIKLITESFCQSKKRKYEDEKERLLKEGQIILNANQEGIGNIINIYGIIDGKLPDEITRTLPCRRKNGDKAFGLLLEYLPSSMAAELDPSLSESGIDTHRSMKEKLFILKEIVSGLADLHARGKVHGDLKPDNVLISEQTPPSVKLIDFGLAEIRPPVIKKDSTVIVVNQFQGTIVYSAPEMIPDISNPAKPIAASSRSTDMYAFAFLCWEYLSCQKPFEDDEDFIPSILKGARPDLGSLPIDTPKEIIEMIQHCWSPVREERKSALECFEILSANLAKEEETPSNEMSEPFFPEEKMKIQEDLKAWMLDKKLPVELETTLENAWVYNLNDLINLPEVARKTIGDTLKPIPRKKFLDSIVQHEKIIGSKTEEIKTDIPLPEELRSWASEFELDGKIMSIFMTNGMNSEAEIGKLWTEDPEKINALLASSMIPFSIGLKGALYRAQSVYVINKKRDETLAEALPVKEKGLSEDLLKWISDKKISVEIANEFLSFSILSLRDVAMASEEKILEIGNFLKPIPKKKFLDSVKELRIFFGLIAPDPVPIAPTVPVHEVEDFFPPWIPDEDFFVDDEEYFGDEIVQSVEAILTIGELRNQLELENESILTIHELMSKRGNSASTTFSDKAFQVLNQSLIEHRDRARRLRKLIQSRPGANPEGETEKMPPDLTILKTSKLITFSANVRLNLIVRDYSYKKSNSHATEIPVKIEKSGIPAVSPEKSKGEAAKNWTCAICKKVNSSDVSKCSDCFTFRNEPSKSPTDKGLKLSYRFSFGSPPPTKPPPGVRECINCKNWTDKQFFCMYCVKDHEKKIGHPFDGTCYKCLICKEWTMNEEKVCNHCEKKAKAKDAKESKAGPDLIPIPVKAPKPTKPTGEVAKTWICTICKKSNSSDFNACSDCFTSRTGKVSSGVSAAKPPPGVRECIGCKNWTDKQFFCMNCIKDHEKKIGHPFDGTCYKCLICKEWTMNEEKVCNHCEKKAKAKDAKESKAGPDLIPIPVKAPKPTKPTGEVAKTWICTICKGVNSSDVNKCSDCFTFRTDKGPAVNPAKPPPGVRECIGCKNWTDKQFFCMNCVKAHEKKIGHPYDGTCYKCIDCKEWTMNEEKVCNLCEKKKKAEIKK